MSLNHKNEMDAKLSLLYFMQDDLIKTPQSTVLCVFVHAHLPLAHLNACNVHNEQQELVRHNNTHGRDKMDSLLGVSLLPLLSWLPRR